MDLTYPQIAGIFVAGIVVFIAAIIAIIYCFADNSPPKLSSEETRRREEEAALEIELQEARKQPGDERRVELLKARLEEVRTREARDVVQTHYAMSDEDYFRGS